MAETNQPPEINIDELQKDDAVVLAGQQYRVSRVSDFGRGGTKEKTVTLRAPNGREMVVTKNNLQGIATLTRGSLDELLRDEQSAGEHKTEKDASIAVARQNALEIVRNRKLKLVRAEVNGGDFLTDPLRNTTLEASIGVYEGGNDLGNVEYYSQIYKGAVVQERTISNITDPSLKPLADYLSVELAEGKNRETKELNDFMREAREITA